MKQYEKYKDSGIEWIGEIPQSWVVTFLKRYSSNITDGSHHSPRTELEGRNYVSVKDVDYFGNIDLINCKKISEEDFNHLVVNGCQPDYGDVLLTKDGTIGRAAVVETNNDFVVLSSLGIIKPNKNKLDSRFLRYFIISGINVEQMFSMIAGAALTRLTIDKIKHLLFTLPSLEEQNQIGKYLDHQTKLIDQLITKKENLVQLLQEQRQAIINEAVTKGLDPNVKMKDSGIEWLGEIPEEWEVKRVNHISEEMISGPFGSSLKKEFYVKKGYKIYGQEQVIKNDFGYGDYYISEEKFKELRRCEIFSGDVLISCVGTFGKIALVPDNFEKGIINPRLVKITPDKSKINPKYFLILLRSKITYSQLESMNRGGVMGVINLGILSQLRFPIPKIEIQDKIIDFVEKRINKFEAIDVLLNSQIKKLKEYRQSVISEAVTGKVDVRDWQPTNKAAV